MRTPLALLVTQIQFARQRENRDVPLTEALAGMHKSSRKLTTLTNKLLLLAQAESAAPANVRERVDLSALIAGVLEELIAFAQSREIDLGAELEDGLYVTGDEALTAALVTNLVDNALRYTQPGGRVTVHTRHSNDMAIVRVIDNGPGIKAGRERACSSASIARRVTPTEPASACRSCARSPTGARRHRSRSSRERAVSAWSLPSR